MILKIVITGPNKIGKTLLAAEIDQHLRSLGIQTAYTEDQGGVDQFKKFISIPRNMLQQRLPRTDILFIEELHTNKE